MASILRAGLHTHDELLAYEARQQASIRRGGGGLCRVQLDLEYRAASHRTLPRVDRFSGGYVEEVWAAGGNYALTKCLRRKSANLSNCLTNDTTAFPYTTVFGECKRNMEN
jgi:hypothetical protein